MIGRTTLPDPFPTDYEKFIHVSRYARWIEEEKRRENWDETVDRYMVFMNSHVEKTTGFKVSEELYDELWLGIYNFEAVPSMRAMMTAGPALERDNTAGYNCFGGDELFITDKGLKSFKEVVGTTVNVLNKDSHFVPAEVRSFGRQKLNKVTVRPSRKTNVKQTIAVTPNHTWFTQNGKTTDLKVGDRLPSQTVTHHTTDSEAWIAGFGFGDGTIDTRGRAKVRLCGQKDMKHLSVFEDYGHSSICNPPSYKGDAVVIFHKGHYENWKQIPYHKLEDLDYLQSWLQGYLAADGHTRKEQPGIASQDYAAMQFVYYIAPQCGYVVTGWNVLSSMQTNYGIRKNPLIRLTLREQTEFIVESIEEGVEEEVYCVVEPITNSFTLASGLVTGNCAYLPIDDMKSFDEAMYILLCGTGVGFSVERQYINRLPEIPNLLFESDTVVVIKDSKEGWAKGLRQLIALLYSGEVPKWDVGRVRPAGARLKTFGGRASGPEPLEDLFRFVVGKFKAANGRRLNSLECHDILCKIGEVVVVGGVRRSAMISLSNLSDDRMRKAKMGEWWSNEGQRALSNNSIAYTEKPDVGSFMEEWASLYQSKSGERGIFNRVASQRQAAKNGRRASDFEFGTNPCSEIILRPYQFCNLTEVVVRAGDTQDDLIRKVRLATILGTFQSTLTNFPYLRKIWTTNTEEERLLGVSLTGQLDNRDFYEGKIDESVLLAYAIATNLEYSTLLGIPQSTAVTCVKPSGTVSQLVDAASGLHARHSPYYIRSVRADNKDPMTKFLVESGVPNEPDVTKKDSTTIFYFPIKSPEGSVIRGNQTAIKQLEYWKRIQENWCEHKPSVTVSVKEDEWPEVGGWVYKNFDVISGISFLPYSDHTYRQAPYQECTEKEYLEMKARMPKEIRWEDLSFYELEDTTSGMQTLACAADGCEVVDIT